MRRLLFIPTYNCAPQLARVLDRLRSDVLDRFDEAIVVDNRSKDHTVETARRFRDESGTTKLKILVNDENYGLGGSHKVAFNYARAHGHDVVVVLHGDDQADPSDIPRMLAILEDGEGHDAVLGGRFCRDSRVTGYSKTRIYGNKFLNLLYTIVLGRRVQDLGAGLNAYRVRRLAEIDYDGFSDYCDFNFYLLMATLDDRWRMKVMPIIWREEDQVSNTNALRMGIKALKALFGWRWRRTMILIPARTRTYTPL